MPSLPTERTRARLDALSTAGLDVPTFVAGSLDVLHGAVPFAAACVATVDPATTLVTSATKWGTMTDVSPGQDAEWAYHEYVGDDLYDYRDLAHRPGGVMTTHHETDGDPRRSQRFGEFFHPLWSVTDELRTAATVDGALWAFFALFRDCGRRTATFSAAEMEFVSGVSGSLARGMRAGLVASAATMREDPSGPAVLVVGDDGDVLQASPAAAARVAELGGGPLGSSALPLALQSVVRVARRFARGEQDRVPRLRTRTLDGRWVVVSASPLQSFSPDTPSTVVVTVEDAASSDVMPLVVAAFGLTPREQDVVRLVLRGVSTTGIARELHLSAYTVQDHLKSVFDKVGVRSRRELTARVFFDEYAPVLASGLLPRPSGRPARP